MTNDNKQIGNQLTCGTIPIPPIGHQGKTLHHYIKEIISVPFYSHDPPRSTCRSLTLNQPVTASSDITLLQALATWGQFLQMTPNSTNSTPCHVHEGQEERFPSLDLPTSPGPTRSVTHSHGPHLTAAGNNFPASPYFSMRKGSPSPTLKSLSSRTWHD